MNCNSVFLICFHRLSDAYANVLPSRFTIFLPPRRRRGSMRDSGVRKPLDPGDKDVGRFP
jgi:hypothetical protein